MTVIRNVPVTYLLADPPDVLVRGETPGRLVGDIEPEVDKVCLPGCSAFHPLLLPRPSFS